MPDHIVVIIIGVSVSVIWVCFCDRERVFEASVVGLQYLTSVSSVEHCPLQNDVCSRFRCSSNNFCWSPMGVCLVSHEDVISRL